jgi:hypothetical protein
MSTQFDHASVVKKSNVFFDGKCISHTVILADGSKKSVGVILPSTLVFNTGVPVISAVLFPSYILLLMLMPVIVNANGVTVLDGTEMLADVAPSVDTSISPEYVPTIVVESKRI